MSLVSLLMPEGEFRVIRCETADKLIQCGNSDAALLYLYMIRKGTDFEERSAMHDLHFSQTRYDQAVFTLTNLTAKTSAASTNPVSTPMPSYTVADLRDARSSDHKFQAICDAAEGILNHTLTDSLLRTLYTVYDYIHLPAEVIIELLSHLKRSQGTVRGADIKREACIWSDKGILTTADAQRYLAVFDAEQPLRDAFYQVFHIVGRKPTASETSLIRLCLEKGFPPEAAKLAITRTKRRTGEFSASYMRKMMEAWDRKGVHTISEITAIEPETYAQQPADADTQPFSRIAEQPQQTEEDELADWEKEWLEEVKYRKSLQSEE